MTAKHRERLRLLWIERRSDANLALQRATQAIDALSDLDFIPDETDMLVCFAANTVQGSLALLEKADRSLRVKLEADEQKRSAKQLRRSRGRIGVR